MSFRQKTILIPGKLKGLFFRWRVDRIIPIHLLSFTAHAAELSKWISKHKKGCENDFYSRKFQYNKRELLFEKIINTQELDAAIDYFEFGVSKGRRSIFSSLDVICLQLYNYLHSHFYC